MRDKFKRMTALDLNVVLDAELHDAIGFSSSGLSQDRRRAMEAYLGDPLPGDAKLDKSQSKYISRDVQDTIEWIMPQLAEVFLSHENVIEFEPVGPEDVESARVETLYTQYVLFRQNPGFRVIHNHIKDGLLQKMAIVKHWWDSSEKEEREEYQNLTDEELQLLLGEEGVEVIEHTARTPDGSFETAEFDLGLGLEHDVVLIRRQEAGRVVIENVPPEEFYFSKRTRCKEDMDFCAHRTKKTVSELIQMGFSRAAVIKAAHEAFSQMDEEAKEEALARHSDDETMALPGMRERMDFAMRELDFEECYIRIDADGDGIAELRQISRIGKNILVNEEIEEFPFTFFSPILMPHKLVGRSVADLVEDLQKLKSHLIRSMLDNISTHNHGRWAVVQGMVNIDDLLTTRPQGIVREKVANAVRRLDAPNLPPEAFQMLAYVDGVREERSGVSRVQAGLDSKALGSNTASGAVSQVMSAAMQRIQLIARVYAETALKEMVRCVHGLVTRNEKQSKVIRVTNQFIPVNPAEFKLRYDLTVAAGIGTATRDQKLLHLTSLGQDVAMMIQMGAMQTGLISPKNIYNLISEKVRNMGFKDGDMFVTDPETLPPPPEEGPSPEEQKLMLEVQKLQAETQLAMEEIEVKKGELILKKAKQEAELMEIRHKMRMDELELALKERELEAEIRLGRGMKIGG